MVGVFCSIDPRAEFIKDVPTYIYTPLEHHNTPFSASGVAVANVKVGAVGAIADPAQKSRTDLVGGKVIPRAGLAVLAALPSVEWRAR